MLYLFYVGQHLLESVLWSLPESKAFVTLWGRPLQVLLPLVFLLVLLWQRDSFWYVHLKSQQNSPIYSLKTLMLSWLPGESALLALPCSQWQKAMPWFLQTWNVFPSLCSPLMSLSGKGTNLVRNWRLILELQSSWLLKWWTMTLFPSQRTCGV